VYDDTTATDTTIGPGTGEGPNGPVSGPGTFGPGTDTTDPTRPGRGPNGSATDPFNGNEYNPGTGVPTDATNPFNKPEWDPSNPFADTTKPAFDPNDPFGDKKKPEEGKTRDPNATGGDRTRDPNAAGGKTRDPNAAGGKTRDPNAAGGKEEGKTREKPQTTKDPNAAGGKTKEEGKEGPQFQPGTNPKKRFLQTDATVGIQPIGQPTIVGGKGTTTPGAGSTPGITTTAIGTAADGTFPTTTDTCAPTPAQ